MCVKKICNVNNVGQLIKLIYVTSKFGWSHNIRILSGFLWTRGESYTEKAINAAVSYQLLPFKYISTSPTPFCTTGSEFLGNIHVYTKIHTLRTSMRISCTKHGRRWNKQHTTHIQTNNGQRRWQNRQKIWPQEEQWWSSENGWWAIADFACCKSLKACAD